MNQTIYPYTSPKTGKIYNVPWNAPDPPTDADFKELENQIAQQETQAPASATSSKDEFGEGFLQKFHPLDAAFNVAKALPGAIADPAGTIKQAFQTEQARQAAMGPLSVQVTNTGNTPSILHRLPLVGDWLGDAADAVRQGHMGRGLGQGLGGVAEMEVLGVGGRAIPKVPIEGIRTAAATGLDALAAGAREIRPHGPIGAVTKAAIPPSLTKLAEILRPSASTVEVPVTAAQAAKAAQAEANNAALVREMELRRGAGTSGAPSAPPPMSPVASHAQDPVDLMLQLEREARAAKAATGTAPQRSSGMPPAPPRVPSAPLPEAPQTRSSGMPPPPPTAPRAAPVEPPVTRSQGQPGPAPTALQRLIEDLPPNRSSGMPPPPPSAPRPKPPVEPAENTGETGPKPKAAPKATVKPTEPPAAKPTTPKEKGTSMNWEQAKAATAAQASKRVNSEADLANFAKREQAGDTPAQAAEYVIKDRAERAYVKKTNGGVDAGFEGAVDRDMKPGELAAQAQASIDEAALLKATKEAEAKGSPLPKVPFRGFGTPAMVKAIGVRKPAR